MSDNSSLATSAQQAWADIFTAHRLPISLSPEETAEALKGLDPAVIRSCQWALAGTGFAPKGFLPDGDVGDLTLRTLTAFKAACKEE